MRSPDGLKTMQVIEASRRSAADRCPADVELEVHPARVGVLDEDLPRALERAVALRVDVPERNSPSWLWPKIRPVPIFTDRSPRRFIVSAVASVFA